MSDNLPIQPPANVPAHQLYYVLAADMATYNDYEMTIEGYQMVLASAEDEFEACDIARNALEEGLVPITAYSRGELLEIADTLLRHPPLPPGRSYNLSHCKTDEEMAELRADARMASKTGKP